jgi:hypothetical protein
MSNLGFRLALVLVTLPVRALAQPTAVPSTGTAVPQVTLHYLGDPGCPNETEFVDEVTARVRRTVQWSKAGAAVQMVVIIRQAGDHASGTLEVVQRSTEPTRREFTAGSCAEVGSALALVAALTLDPNARTEQLPAHVRLPPHPDALRFPQQVRNLRLRMQNRGRIQDRQHAWRSPKPSLQQLLQDLRATNEYRIPG